MCMWVWVSVWAFRRIARWVSHRRDSHLGRSAICALQHTHRSRPQHAQDGCRSEVRPETEMVVQMPRSAANRSQVHTRSLPIDQRPSGPESMGAISD
jgi:hypothetical protein